MSNNPFRNSLLRDYGRTSVSPHECQVPSNWPPQNLATAISSGASQTGVHIVLSGQEFVSTHFGTSQYDLGGPSACGLASLNAVRIVLDLEHSGVVGLNLLEEMAKQSLMEKVTAICTSATGQLHLEVEDVLALPLFSQFLESVDSEFGAPGEMNFRKTLQRLVELSNKHDASYSVAAVITRPPEIIAVFTIKTGLQHCPHVFVIFDSHARPPKHSGSAFIFFPSIELAATYLNELLQVDRALLADPYMQWQAQLLAQYSAHILRIRRQHSDIMELIYKSNVAILEGKAREASLELEKSAAEAEQKRLEAEIVQLREARERGLRALSNLRLSHIDLPKGSASFEPPRTIAGGVAKTSAPSTSSQSPVTYSSAAKGKGKMKVPGTDTSLDVSGRHRNELYSNSGGTSLDDSRTLDYDIAEQLQREFDFEGDQMRSEAAELARTAQVAFHCALCLESHAQDFATIIDVCGHTFCRESIRGYIVTKIEEHRYPVLCPVCSVDRSRTSDPGVINGTLVQQVGISQRQYEVWDELEMSTYSVVIDCPRCLRSSFVDRNDHKSTSLLSCPLPDCGTLWCKDCNRRIVSRANVHSCDGSAELDQLMEQKSWKKCPGCQTPTERTGGCNHMTCGAPGCNTHFCWVCGSQIVQSVLRREIRAALQTHYRQCRLFEDIADADNPP